MRKLIVGGALGSVAAIAVSRLGGLTVLVRQTTKLGQAGRNRISGALNVRPPDEVPKEELYEEAKERDIPGRSTMTKEELIDALDEEQ
jgi:hypothetical protein